MSLFPIRCFTCGKVIGNLYELYEKKITEKITAQEVLDELKVNRFCCRRMFLSYAPEIEENMMKYDHARIVDNRIKKNKN